jgi:hypothetical protein
MLAFSLIKHACFRSCFCAVGPIDRDSDPSVSVSLFRGVLVPSSNMTVYTMEAIITLQGRETSSWLYATAKLVPSSD